MLYLLRLNEGIPLLFFAKNCLYLYNFYLICNSDWSCSAEVELYSFLSRSIGKGLNTYLARDGKFSYYGRSSMSASPLLSLTFLVAYFRRRSSEFFDHFSLIFKIYFNYYRNLVNYERSTSDFSLKIKG
jgi:hypothetical protein